MKANNYRGMALLLCMGTFVNVLINETITQFALSNKITKQEQFGFVKGNGISDCLRTPHSLVDYYLNKTKTKLYGVLIDFEKAYYKAPRDILLMKLNNVVLRSIFQQGHL